MTTETSIYEYAKQGSAMFQERPALWFYGKSINYRRLFELINHTADQLYGLGIRQGTVVTIHLPNCPQAVIAIYAVAKIGGVCNMVHALTPALALEENMAFTKSEWLITHIPECVVAARNVLLVDVSYHMGLTARLGYRFKNGIKEKTAVRSFEDLEREPLIHGFFPCGSDIAAEAAVYLHSSGSTGKPKTIVLSHSALNNCISNTADFFEQGDMADQVSLGVLPLFHGFGLAMDVHRNISFGSQLVLLPRWNAKTAVKLIKKRGVTLMVGVPTMYYALLNEPTFRGKKISQLSKCYVGGDNVKPELIDLFDSRLGGGHRMFVGFGLTEATTTDCVNSYLHYKSGSSGYPVRNTTIAVINEAGEISLAGEGELIISSKTLMMGYLNDPQATETTLFFANGKQWTHTGDRVRIDEDGFLYFMSRIKNIIIHNGYNVYPEQVEEVVRLVPGVSDACVVGISDEVLHTQNVRAVVVLRPGVEPGIVRDAIRQECLRRLPRYAVPKQIIFTEAFPQNAMGKIDRKELSRL